MGHGIENTENQPSNTQNDGKVEINALEQETIQVPSSDFIANSTLSRDGQDLTIESSNGETIVVSNYFMADPAPVIEAPNGTVLTQNLVHSFLNSGSEYASNDTLNDESPVGAVEEMSGEATVTRADGTTEPLMLGAPIFNGDVIETSGDGAVNIMFIDETSMAVSENARMSVDNYDYQAETESGVTNLSVLRGVFVYTSGLIGRDDPDDVSINTPVGSIGIRGTIIAGKISPSGESEITVVEGAIVVKNSTGDVTLSQQYETVKIGGFNTDIETHGIKTADEVNNTYGSVSGVSPGLFSSINDNAKEQQAQQEQKKADEVKEEVKAEEKQEQEAAQEEIKAEEAQEKKSIFEENKPNQENRSDDVKELLLDNAKIDNIKSELNHRNFNSRQEARQFFEAREDVLSANPENNGQENPTTESITVAGINSVSAGVATLPPPQQYDFNNDGTVDEINGNQNVNAGGISGSGSITIQPNGGSDIIIDNPSPAAGDNFGSSVSFLGDFNGDGETDFIVGATNNYNIDGALGIGNSNHAGSSFVYVQGSGYSQIVGEGDSSTNLGKQVFNIGDINADGLTDIMIGSDGAHKAYIKLGTPSLVGSELANGLTKTDTDVNVIAGGAAGDINGDGNDDFAISVQEGSDMATYVVYGDQIAGTMDSAWLNNSANALKIVHQGGYAPGTSYQIHNLGDVDGDGYDDIQVGNQSGAQFVVYGDKNVMDTDVIEDGDAGDASANDGQIFASGNNQALVGDGQFYDSFQTGTSMRGGNSDNAFKITDTNFKNIDGGEGHDTIKFEAPISGTLDFSAVNFEQISQIEEIEFGASGQEIQLTTENLFNLLKSSDTQSLHITGINGPITGDNILTLNGGSDYNADLGSLGFTNNETGGDSDADGYIHYSKGDYNLYVDVDVQNV